VRNAGTTLVLIGTANGFAVQLANQCLPSERIRVNGRRQRFSGVKRSFHIAALVITYYGKFAGLVQYKCYQDLPA
jgi:hypothetical protein